MKKTFLLILFLFASLSLLPSSAVAQSWLWARGSIIHALRLGGNANNGITSDGYGNAYVINNFAADSVTFAPYTLSSGVAFDTFLAYGALVKYDPFGNVLWAKYIGGNDSSFLLNHITVDLANNIYISGTFRGATISICGITLHRVGPVNNINFFVAKFDPSGNIIWAQNNSGTQGTSLGVSLATDDQCNLYLAGDFTGTIYYGTDSLTQGTYSTDILLVKLDSAGHYIFCRNAGGAYHDRANSVYVDHNKNIYISGYFGSSTFIFGPDTLHTSLMPSSYYDNCILKYDSSGTPVWARRIPIHDIEYSQVITDNNNDIYTISTFGYSTLAIGPYTLHSAGSLDFYVAKYDPLGNVIWAKSGGGTDLDHGFGITLDHAGQLWICGGTRSATMVLDTMHLTSDISTNGSGWLARLDTNGNALFMASFRNGSYIAQNYIIRDVHSNVFISGTYANGNCVIGVDTLQNIPSIGGVLLWNCYLAKYNYTNADATLGINNIMPADDIQVYPNPASNEFTVSNKGAVDIRASMALYNITGQQVGVYPMAGNSVTISTLSLPRGIYVCRVLTNGTTTVKKILIQ